MNAIALLLLAFQLLTVVSSTPNVPQPLHDQAIAVANLAIERAQAELAAPAPASQAQYPASQAQAPQAAPSFGATIASMEPKLTVTPVARTPQMIIKDEKNGMPFGSYQYEVRLTGADGNGINKALSTLTYGGKTYERIANTRTTLDSKDYFTTYEIIPMQAGELKLTFSAGGLSEEITLIVQ